MESYDVAIIGAGVVGAAIARELSKYQLKICLIEKEDDVAAGTTKANSGIVHGGYAAKHGSLKAKFCRPGNLLYRKLEQELNFGFADIGSLVIGFDNNDRKTIEEEYENGIKNGVASLEIVDTDYIKKHEPNLNSAITCALLCKSAGVTSPYNFAIALAENAVVNGVKLFLNSEVTAINKQKNEFVITVANNLQLTSKLIINAAGLYSDTIANLIGAADFAIKPRRGQYLLFDKQLGNLVNAVIFQTPTPVSKGILVTNTYHGNLLVGPDAENINDKTNLDTVGASLTEIIKAAHKSLPEFDLRKVITSFAGNRAASDRGDFIIEESNVKRFINVAGIESPGLTSAPAIAEYVVELIANAGMELQLNRSFQPYRKPYPTVADLSAKELEELLATNPLYGRIICRCETISEAEIIDILHGPIPINTLDAIKRRVRAGMGRCQGGFCTPRLLEIMQRELGIPMEKLSKKSGRSQLIVGRTK